MDSLEEEHWLTKLDEAIVHTDSAVESEARLEKMFASAAEKGLLRFGRPALTHARFGR